jgi:hypothetical protein
LNSILRRLKVSRLYTVDTEAYQLSMATRSSGTRVVLIAVTLAIATGGNLALAGEEDDLQRQIEIQRTGAADLERLDELKAVGDEIGLLRSWLDEAWSLRSKHEYDQVREVVDRAREQADLIRAKITVSKLKAQAEKREAALAQLKAKIARTRKALADAAAKKKQLEGSAQ